MNARRWEELGNALGERLQHAGCLDQVELSYVRQKQQVDRKPLWRTLVDEGVLPDDVVAEHLAATLDVPFMREQDLPPVHVPLSARLSEEFCRTAELLPLESSEPDVLVAIGDTLPDLAQQALASRLGLRSRVVMAPFGAVRRLIREHFQYRKHSVKALANQEAERLAADRALDTSPAQWFQHLLHWAVQERATDIHITPGPSSLHVLFRVDGVLRPMMALQPALQRVVSYVKLSAEMDIAEHRRPQDGSFHTLIWDAPFTVRVSSLTPEFGERLVLRLLPEDSEAKDLRALGFLPDAVRVLEQVSATSSGMILVTGPTGAGKSSTLHACLRAQHLIERNVLTVEDPLEYRVPAAAQTQVNRKAGYDFAAALRHFLRHDPDVILLGEMRDAETACAAFDAATTGHLVLSTLHVTTAFGVMSRLRPFGVTTQSVADNLSVVINQRLVRRLCRQCARQDVVTPAQAAWLGVAPGSACARAVGCEACGGTGYHGRLPIYELLLVDDAVAHCIAQDADRNALRRAAEAAGHRPISAVAKHRIAALETTFEEVYFAIGEGPTDG